MGVRDDVDVGVFVRVLVAVAVVVFVGVFVRVDVGVFVLVLVGVLVGVFVGVFVGVQVNVFVGVLVGVGVTTIAQLENSDVLLVGLVAVVVIKSVSNAVGGIVMSIFAKPAPSVVALPAPRKVCPSPKPPASQARFKKISIRYVVFAAAVRVPMTRVLP